jgi:hypothetical protein
MNKNERMEKLNNAGINTGKYFSIDLPEGIKPGATISLVINENGQPIIMNNKPDPIVEQILNDGYVRNTKLHRRFVMAQMFQMLNYESHYDSYEEGFHACLRNRYGYDYTFKMMLEEVRVLSKLEVRDMESFEERSHFFTKSVVVEVVCDYIEKLKEYVDRLPTKKCKGVPYKRIKGMNVFVEDLDKKIYRPFMDKVAYMKIAHNYNALYKYLKEFMSNMIDLHYRTPKSKAWIDAFKGEGAYYTLKNLVMYHDCVIHESVYGMFNKRQTVVHRGIDAVKYINHKLDEYQGEGWRMFALMKKVISDNDFDFNKRMVELGVK